MSRRPFVLASFAQTLDGALSNADSRPLAISGPLSKLLTHALRGRLDAILVGIGTVLADDPVLNCRVAELVEHWNGSIGVKGTAGILSGVPSYRQPHRIVLDPRLEIPDAARILEGLERAPLTVFYHPDSVSQTSSGNASNASQIRKAERLASMGVMLRPTVGLRASWPEILDYLREAGLASLFIEGGRRVLSSVLEEGFADALIITQAPLIQGGAPSWYPREVPRSYVLSSILHAGADLVAEYRPAVPGVPGDASPGALATALPAPPYRSLALLAGELGLPGLEPLAPLAMASRFFNPAEAVPPAGHNADSQTEAAGSFALSPERRLECRQLVFTAPGRVGLRKLCLEPAPDELVVESRCIGISAGTELAVFRGECSDFSGEALPGLQPTGYPLAYGYINVGLAPDGSRVFGFAAHQERFCAKPGDLIQLGGLSWEDAVFLPSMETALGIVHDAHPRPGDRYCVAGQGVVGLLVTRILVSMGVGVISLETSGFRRRISREAGALPLDPGDPGLAAELARLTGGNGWDRAINCSGSEAALQTLIDLAPADSTIVEASWYADRKVQLGLGQAFHRKRLHLASSQVSFLGPGMGRSWTKARRFAVVLDLLDRLRPASYISHRFSMEEADKAYAVLSSPGAEVLQIIIDPGL
ncbi:MAG: dihydrofolate reductase family protein [Clostridia bacterium]